MMEDRVKRKLSAILSADVAGYSRLMGEDEVSTVRTLEAYRKVMSDLIEQFRGRVVDSPGDNLLSEFSSVVDAVQCAVEIHEVIRAKNEELPEDRRMLFRIGVNLGDVIEEGDRIYGDGVNIAARLEGLAEAGGICISGSAHEQIENKLALGYEFLGEHAVKNIIKPVKVYRVPMGPKAAFPKEGNKRKAKLKNWQWTALGAAGAIIVIIGALAIWNFCLRGPSIEPASVERMAYLLPDKPSIAVLPFTNMSGDLEQDYIGDGLSENIISALSFSSEIFVIASNSTFTYKGKPVKVQQVAEDLGVQYVLEGSIQKSGDQLRVTAQLIDALSGHHLWSEVYDREMRNLFDLQDEITKKIIVSLQVELGDWGEDLRLYAKSTNNLEAWKHYIKGMELFFNYIEEDNAKAREHSETALELDPQYVSALSQLGWTHLWDFLMGWSDSPSASFNRALEFAQKAVKLNDKDPFSRGLLGVVSLYQGQFENAIFEGKRAVTLNPNYALGYGALAYILFFYGQFDEAITMTEKAYRLNPNLHPVFLINLARSYIFLERYEKALEVCDEMEEQILNGRLVGFKYVPPLFSSWIYQELGREEEACAYMAEALKRKPEYSLVRAKTLCPYKNPAHLQRMLDAYRKAGMPERAPGAVQEKPSIAVLPFVNISGDPEQEYFSDGMTEEIINALANVEGLKVISRTSSFFFKGKDVDLRTIGEKLNVDTVIEGSVRKAGNRIRITAQLVKVADDTHLWSETYDREMEEVFVIQEEISMAVVESLKLRLLGIKAEPLVKDYTDTTEAYELFLKGLFFQGKGISSEWWSKAIDCYERAIKADPKYAPAYSKLAMVHFILSMQFSLQPNEMWPKVESLALKALEIDEMDSDAHTSMGIFKAFYKYDWQGAEIDFKRAIDLNPSNSEAYLHYGAYLLTVGRVYEAIEKMKRSLELDPVSVYVNSMLGTAFLFAYDFDKAITQSKKTLELSPDAPIALRALAISYGEKGMNDKGISILQQVRGFPLDQSILGHMYGNSGERKEAHKILDEFLERSEKGYFSPNMIAKVYAGLGEKDKAFEWLDKSIEEHDPENWNIKVDPHFDDLHSDPRWIKLMEKMNLAH